MRKPDWRLWLKDKKECKAWLDIYERKSMLRKSADESNLHIRKTEHNLNLANWVFEKHNDEIPEIFAKETFYDWVISMYYYAVYHAALALISREGFKSTSHSATLCFLIYHHYHMQKSIDEGDITLIARSLEKEYIETIGISKELRERASYNVHELFEKALAMHTREEAVTFVNKIKEMLSL